MWWDRRLWDLKANQATMGNQYKPQSLISPTTSKRIVPNFPMLLMLGWLPPQIGRYLKISKKYLKIFEGQSDHNVTEGNQQRSTLSPPWQTNKHMMWQKQPISLPLSSYLLALASTKHKLWQFFPLLSMDSVYMYFTSPVTPDLCLCSAWPWLWEWISGIFCLRIANMLLDKVSQMSLQCTMHIHI